MQALTQCWFTRIHRPDRERQREADGSVTSTCRYCHQPLVCWDKTNWTLSRGFDVSRAAEQASGRYLTLFDCAGDFVVRRIPIAHLEDEAAVNAFKARLREEYRLDDIDNTLELRDSAPRSRPRRKPKPVIDLPAAGNELPI